MRKVILFMHMSLDGYVCGPNGEQDWMTVGDAGMAHYLIPDLLKTVDTMLVGRVLYQGFMSYWPNVPKDAANPKELIEFAHWMENTPKVVFSKTLDKAEWKNSILAKGDVAEEIARLKQQPGGDMVVFGGAGLVQTLTRLNLVDEYRIKSEPVVLGKGKALFSDVQQRIPLKLLKSKAFDSGVVAGSYEVIRK